MGIEDQPKLLWSPSEKFQNNSNLSDYMGWLSTNKKLHFQDYNSLWEWSTSSIEEFWASLWEYFEIQSSNPYSSVVEGKSMPFIKWFTDAEINYAERTFQNYTDQYPAIIHKKEGSDLQEISWAELKERVSRFQDFLTQCGIEKGDRVVAYISNVPEATIAFLATVSLGAVWSSCSPDFGVSSVVDRFSQVSPKVLIATSGYQYGGKYFDKSSDIQQVISRLPDLEKVVVVPGNEKLPVINDFPKAVLWSTALETQHSELTFTRVPFNQPIYILYSSGTTGIPKAITHGQGGILLEHLKYLTFHNDVKKGDRCFWFTTTGWMMWNYIQSSLLVGGTMILYDGSPGWPEIDALWQFAEEAKITHLGTSAGYIVANMKEGKNPGKDYNLSSLTSIGSTGSPLPPEGFDWIYDKVKKDLWLTSISGGTDVCSAFVGGNPLWSVYSGEIQCRALGCKLEAFNEAGKPVLGEVGEMVITAPMPSMPIYFWNDPEFERYKSSYFEMFSGVWRHGDWTQITERNGIVIYGRSDATLNRGGVRIGTSEVYRAVDKVPEVSDSLILSLEQEGGEFYMPLFVIMNEGHPLSEDNINKIKRTIRKECTPRHVPDEIISVEAIPYTISGKKTESPVKRVLMGHDPDKAINRDALKNPEAMEFFIKMAKEKKY